MHRIYILIGETVPVSTDLIAIRSADVNGIFNDPEEVDGYVLSTAFAHEITSAPPVNGVKTLRVLFDVPTEKFKDSPAPILTGVDAEYAHTS